MEPVTFSTFIHTALLEIRVGVPGLTIRDNFLIILFVEGNERLTFHIHIYIFERIRFLNEQVRFDFRGFLTCM